MIGKQSQIEVAGIIAQIAKSIVDGGVIVLAMKTEVYINGRGNFYIEFLDGETKQQTQEETKPAGETLQ